jgi:hypothetical protein
MMFFTFSLGQIEIHASKECPEETNSLAAPYWGSQAVLKLHTGIADYQ